MEGMKAIIMVSRLKLQQKPMEPNRQRLIQLHENLKHLLDFRKELS